MIKIKDLELLKNVDVLFENEIILYGAGDYGKRAYNLLKGLELPVLGFCDSNITKWGEEIEGCKVMSFCEMKDILAEKNKILIFAIADPRSVEQVLEVLERQGMQEINCYTYFALKKTVESHINDYRINEKFRKNEKEKTELFCNYKAQRKEFIALSALYSAISDGNVFLVFQPGKVGSSSVYESLKRERIFCYHIHEFTGNYGWIKTFEKAQKGLWALHKAEKVKIISLVRDPIARGISSYFQRMQESVRGIGYALEPDAYKGVIAFLTDETEKGTYGNMFEWFDIEMKGTFGIDVYQHDFDKRKGYQIIQQDNMELLLLKLEKLNDCVEIIGQFAGVKDFKLMKANMGSDKLYYFAYEELKKTIEIPQSILDFYYKDNFAMDHFYTLEEKEAFYKKWLK